MQVFRHATKTMAAMRYAPAVPKKWLAVRARTSPPFAACANAPWLVAPMYASEA